MRYSKMAVDEMIRVVLKKYGRKVSYRDGAFLTLGIESEKLVCNFGNGLRVDEKDGVFHHDELMFSRSKKIYCVGEWEEKLKRIYDKAVESDDTRAIESRWRKYGLGDYSEVGLSVTVGKYLGHMIVREEKDGSSRTVVDAETGICRPSDGLNRVLQIIKKHKETYRRKNYPEYFAQPGKGSYFTSDEVERMAWNAVSVLGDNDLETSHTYGGADAVTVKSRGVRQSGLFASFAEGKEEGDLTITFNDRIVFSSQLAYDLTGGKENPNRYSATKFEADRMIFAPVFIGGEWEKILEELSRKADETIAMAKAEEEKKRRQRIESFSESCLRYLGNGFENYTIVDKSHDGVTQIEIYETCTKDTKAFKVPTRRFLFRTEDPFVYEEAIWYGDFTHEIKRRRGY